MCLFTQVCVVVLCMLWFTLPSSLGTPQRQKGTERSRRQAARTDVGLERGRLWRVKRGGREGGVD